ncbi:MAG TPA: hypothetical protein VGP93_12105 [Polyangiaceae bacterium]|nr:hypothetical protein [Polyangiaceae bacterium]
MAAEISPGPAWLNPAGGLRYHFRGFRHSRRLWWPFRFALAEWLYAWQPPERRLVVVGPSAGYCIEPLTLERFDELICLEPDPIARYLFARRLARAPLEKRPILHFEASDLILKEPEHFGSFLAKVDDAAVLFSNFLGQLRVLLAVKGASDARLAEVKRAVTASLEGRSWASFHDRVSGALEPGSSDPLASERRLSDEEMVETFYGHHVLDRDAALVGVDGKRPLLDHLTDGIFPADRPHRYFVWQILPGLYHLIEATCAVKTSDNGAVAHEG